MGAMASGRSHESHTMSSRLTQEQQRRLEAALRERQQVLSSRMSKKFDGLTRSEHAREILLQDSDDATQRDADREVDLAITDRETIEFNAIDQALKRLADGSYGECIDCGEHVPFKRLELEPHTLRCVACEARRERSQPRTASM